MSPKGHSILNADGVNVMRKHGPGLGQQPRHHGKAHIANANEANGSGLSEWGRGSVDRHGRHSCLK